VLDIRATLRSALADAVADNLIGANPASAIRLPKARTRRLQTAWTAEEARRFLASARADGDPFYTAYVLLLVLGLRRGEILGLTWPMVDLDAATVQIRYALQRVDGRLVLSETRTLDSEAGLPLPPLCMAALRRQAATRHLARRLAGACWVRHRPRHHHRRDGPVDPRNFHRAFQKRCELAEVRRVPVHSTRHTCASVMVGLGVHPRVAMQILRHAKIATTMDIYTHVPTPDTRAALIELSARLHDGACDVA
jgi:integrase